MSKPKRFPMHKDNALMRLMIMLIVPCILIGSVSMHAYAQSGYVIYDGEERHVVLSEATEPSEVLSEAGLELGRADLIEMNEAFAAQSVHCLRESKMPLEKLNVNGGAIALGHPIGCSGARIMVTLIHELLKREDAKRGMATLCIGGGMGAAGIFEMLD